MSLAPNIAPALKTISNSLASSKVLFIAERSPWGKLGYETVASAFPTAYPIYWSPGMPKPDLSAWHGDWIISFKSDLVLSRDILESAKKGALNFHPSPPKYRGVGGYWWALHNGDNTFGVTCHHMNERIDHGTIITTESFPIWPKETVESLKHRAALQSLALLNNTLNTILSGDDLMPCGAKWGSHLYTYKELALAQNALTINNHNNTAPLYAMQAFEALNAVMKEASNKQALEHSTSNNKQVA